MALSGREQKSSPPLVRHDQVRKSGEGEKFLYPAEKGCGAVVPSEFHAWVGRKKPYVPSPLFSARSECGVPAFRWTHYIFVTVICRQHLGCVSPTPSMLCAVFHV